MKVSWLPRALRRLEQAHRYIQQDKPLAAADTARRIWERAERLGDFPELGRVGRLPGTRELVLPNSPFILLYRIHADRVEILTILHGARRWSESM